MKLSICTLRDEYQIGWVDSDGDFGLMVGHQIPKNDHPDTLECLAIDAALRPMADRVWSACAFAWDTQRSAQVALKRARLVIRQLQDEALARPWPEWTAPALAAGWKPPKGWTP